jgi:L-glyceraldehyde 3-phosphate reductase
MEHNPLHTRYEDIAYRRCGKSGLLLPEISLGLWHNFGGIDTLENGKAMIFRAFDRGVTHFDLANNYGPPPGSAETTFGTILKNHLSTYRDELIISTKAGYKMWDGPYGEWGSRKFMLSSLDQSLKRMQLEYVDIFYSHRYDPNTPLEETALALDQAVRSGKALYVGISNYSPEHTREMSRLLRETRTPFVLHQPKYSMFVRDPEWGLFDAVQDVGIGSIVFSPLAQGLLTNRYLHGIPEGSRASKNTFLSAEDISDERVIRIRKLNDMAAQRGQSLAQMAIAWILRQSAVTSVLVGSSSVGQLDNNLDALKNKQFSNDEFAQIESILN